MKIITKKKETKNFTTSILCGNIKEKEINNVKKEANDNNIENDNK